MQIMFTAATAIALLAGAAPLALAADAKGIWLTANGDAKIRISDCGAKLCGAIAWLNKPFDPDTGKPSLDKQNPDAGKRSRSLMGLTILTGMQPSGSGQWVGPIYNADDGNTYEGKMRLLNPTTLKVEGCAFGVCQGEDWKRSNPN